MSNLDGLILFHNNIDNGRGCLAQRKSVCFVSKIVCASGLVTRWRWSVFYICGKKYEYSIYLKVSLDGCAIYCRHRKLTIFSFSDSKGTPRPESIGPMTSDVQCQTKVLHNIASWWIHSTRVHKYGGVDQSVDEEQCQQPKRNGTAPSKRWLE